ncbi:MAG: hypothetical protein IJR43_03060 [Synergistaceae bacterium]|nr:hypothetical protein [Synergistaceae bacterium]
MNWEYIKQKLKPIADGLFGKQRITRYERPHYEIRKLDYMLGKLAMIPAIEWRHYAFSREPLNGKFSPSQRLEWMRKSIECGKIYAQRMIAEYESDDADIIAHRLGLEVFYPQYPEKTDRVLFADFIKPDRINIFMDAVNRAEKLLRKESVKKILGDNIKPAKIILSHEIFHHIEEKYRHEIFTRTEKIRLWSLGPLHNDSGIYALGEIAAMSFAQELNHLTYFPYLMDVFLVYDYSPEEASGLYEEMMTLAGLEP